MGILIVMYVRRPFDRDWEDLDSCSAVLWFLQISSLAYEKWRQWTRLYEMFLPVQWFCNNIHVPNTRLLVIDYSNCRKENTWKYLFIGKIIKV